VTEIRIALDLSELPANRRGQKILSTLRASNGEEIMTKRGHHAVLIRLETFEKLRRQLGIYLEEGLDGLHLLRVGNEPQKTGASAAVAVALSP
jgi:hypothetical protein